MQHHEMMVQKMKNNPKIRDSEEKDYRASSNVRTDESMEEHRLATVIDHPDGSVTDAKLGQRTINQETTPDSSNQGLLTVLLSWLANRIKAIMGGTLNWYDDPPITLTQAKSHADDTENPHGTTADQVPYTAGGGISSTNVQAAIAELDSEKETPAGAQAKADAAQEAAEATAQAALDLVAAAKADKANYPDDVKLRKNGTSLQASLDGGTTWKTVTLT